MQHFARVRVAAAVIAFLLNAAWALFLALDISMFMGVVHPAPSHKPVTFALLGSAALAIVMIGFAVTANISAGGNARWPSSPRFEISWIAVVLFAQYSTALVNTTLFIFILECNGARPDQNMMCWTVDTTILAGSWAIPVLELVYFSILIHVVRKAARQDTSLWTSPLHSIAEAQYSRDLESDAKSIASFSNFSSETLKAPDVRKLYDPRASIGSVYSVQSSGPRQAPPAALRPLQLPNSMSLQQRYVQALER